MEPHFFAATLNPEFIFKKKKPKKGAGAFFKDFFCCFFYGFLIFFIGRAKISLAVSSVADLQWTQFLH